MARKSVIDNCRICGNRKKMAFGHVPPQSAFNDCPAVYKEGIELINTDPTRYFERGGAISQRGMGAYTLCEQCDNDTGSWYGAAFAKWAHQGMEILGCIQGGTSLYYPFRIYPLRVIKQIMVMFFSINDIRFSYNHPDLVKFVLNKNERYLNPDIHIYAFFNSSMHSRYIGGVGRFEMSPDKLTRDTVEDMVRDANTALDKSRLLSEIACHPIGYVMCFDPVPPDNRLVDISFFARCSYSECRPLYLQLPALPTETYFPGDYRSLEQVRRDAERNQRDTDD